MDDTTLDSYMDDDMVYCHRCQIDCTDDWYFFHGLFWCYDCREHVAKALRRRE